jgi:hypothetical protein
MSGKPDGAQPALPPHTIKQQKDRLTRRRDGGIRRRAIPKHRVIVAKDMGLGNRGPAITLFPIQLHRPTLILEGKVGHAGHVVTLSSAFSLLPSHWSLVLGHSKSGPNNCCLHGKPYDGHWVSTSLKTP